MTLCKVLWVFSFLFAIILHAKPAISLQTVIGHKTKILPLSSRQGEVFTWKDQGCSIKPKTRYAFCEHGLPTTCPKTGIENESVTLISFVAFSARLVTAKPVVP